MQWFPSTCCSGRARFPLMLFSTPFQAAGLCSQQLLMWLWWHLVMEVLHGASLYSSGLILARLGTDKRDKPLQVFVKLTEFRVLRSIKERFTSRTSLTVIKFWIIISTDVDYMKSYINSEISLIQRSKTEENFSIKSMNLLLCRQIWM